MKYIIILFLSYLIFPAGGSFVYAQGSKTLDSREFKILLKAENFTDRRKGIESIWKIIKEFAESKNLKVTESDNMFDEGIREIIYYDTKDLDFLNRNISLRKRTKYSGDELSSNFEFTVKHRVDDIKDADSYDISSREGLDSKGKFEEDIGMDGNMTGTMKSVFSLSNTAKKLSQTIGPKTKDLFTLFPSLAKAGIDNDKEVSVVNDIIIKEYSYEAGEIKFGKGLKAQTELTVWYKKGEKEPFIAEFSYRCKTGTKNIQEESTRASEDFFKTLQNTIKEYIHTGFTKTKMIYNKSE